MFLAAWQNNKGKDYIAYCYPFKTREACREWINDNYFYLENGLNKIIIIDITPTNIFHDKD